MTTRTTPRRRARRILVTASVTVGLLSCMWVLWFLTLRVFAAEGALPPTWRIPAVPPGASVIDSGEACASGGCWWQLTLAPAAGQSPEDLVRKMGLTEEQSLPPTLFDPARVHVTADVTNNTLIVRVGYQ